VPSAYRTIAGNRSRLALREAPAFVAELERAIGRLRSGTPVKGAALEAGFSEPAYFSRMFARRFGVPPSRWREVLG
jgi:AraC-like DNA-binding protein